MRRFAFFALAALIGVLGCGPSQRTLLLEVHVRAPIQRLRVVTVSHGAAGSVSSTEHAITRTPSDVSTDVPIRVAIVFDDRADVTVHLEGRTSAASPVYIATRCYVIEDQLSDDVLLIAADTGADMDGDGWPTLSDPFCRDPLPGMATGDQGCDHMCSAGRDVDCSGCLPGAMPPCTLVADHDATIFPGAAEICENGIDEDCDGHDASCVDSDGDGFTLCGATPSGSCDCDDRNAAIHPGATDTCGDGVDQDCDAHDMLCDHDGDGFPANLPVGGTPDCDDTNAGIHPGATEVCTPMGGSPVDENCNGAIDELASCTPDDLDKDGVPTCTAPGVPPGCDCNDCDSAIHPGAPEQCNDGIDQDCLGGDLPCLAGDADHDGYVATGTGGGNDCDDTMDHTFPNAPEACGDGASQSCGIDLNCSGDTDHDGYVENGMCEGNADITPWKAEACNGIDDDCDGVVDDVPRDTHTGAPLSFSGCIITQPSDPACAAMSPSCAIDFASDLSHCGGCRQACNDATHIVADSCAAGACSCNGGGACDRSANQTCCTTAGCVDLASNFDHCGTCGTDCRSYGGLVDVCSAGACSCGALGAPCAAGQLCCGSVCVNPDNDVNHCGSCTACALANTAQMCFASGCHIGGCVSGYADCDGVEGTGCEQVLNDPSHCGSCTTVCSANAMCMGGPTGLCVCNGGYAGSGTACSDIDECSAGTPCGGNSTCTNSVGSFSCACNAGYRSPSGAGNDCVDINECAVTMTCRADIGGGTCSNNPGGYTCACNPGFVLSGSGSTATCSDVNECLLSTTCHADTGAGTCANTSGAYTCACNPGYMLMGTGLSATCVDIDECASSATCHAGSSYGTCSNMPGGYTCSCGAGYRRTGSAPLGQDCADTDECTMTPTICGPGGSHATCANSVGSYSCGCVAGYADCANGVSDGCEVMLGTTSNCHACGDSCGGGTPKCCPGSGTFNCMSMSSC